MTKKQDFHAKLVEHIYDNIPAFTDIFTEETFYLFVTTFVVSTIIVVFIFSRFITIKPVEWQVGKKNILLSNNKFFGQNYNLVILYL